MIKIVVPDSGIMSSGELKAILQGKSEDEAIAFQGGRYVEPPVIEGDDAAEPDAAVADDAPKPRKGRK